MKPEMKEVHAVRAIPLMPKLEDSTPLASSYDASSAAASTVARPAVGPTPVHRATTPSSLTIVMKQLAMPVYRLGSSLPASSFAMPSVCSRTFIRSEGLAMADATAPAAPPATIFFQRGEAAIREPFPSH